jgi:hypothetical protein
MSQITSSLNISDYTSFAQLKKKVKSYLNEINCSDFKISNFSKGLVITLVMVLEELLSDCLKHVVKNETDGLYKITPLILNTVINDGSKYAFMLKYIKTFNSKLRFNDSIFFNIKKVLDNLESKYGTKLMITVDSANLVSYIILSLQYELVDLSVRMVRYSKKRTLNINALKSSSGFIFSEDIKSKVELKLDSIDEDKEKIEVEEEEVEVEAEVEEDEEEEEDD